MRSGKRVKRLGRLVLHCVSCGRRFRPVTEENVCPTCQVDFS